MPLPQWPPRPGLTAPRQHRGATNSRFPGKWSLFVRLAHPKSRMEALTSRPLLLASIAEKTRHARQERLAITPMHGYAEQARTLLLPVSTLLNT